MLATVGICSQCGALGVPKKAQVLISHCLLLLLRLSICVAPFRYQLILRLRCAGYKRTGYFTQVL